MQTGRGRGCCDRVDEGFADRKEGRGCGERVLLPSSIKSVVRLPFSASIKSITSFHFGTMPHTRSLQFNFTITYYSQKTDIWCTFSPTSQHGETFFTKYLLKLVSSTKYYIFLDKGSMIFLLLLFNVCFFIYFYNIFIKRIFVNSYEK